MDRSADPLDRGGLPPSVGDVHAQLERILGSPAVRLSPRRRALLRYLVEETLAGRGDLLKGFSVALAVFGRDESFDPQADPVVRFEARRLRRDLAQLLRRRRQPRPGSHHHSQGRLRPAFRVAGPRGRARRRAPRARATGGGCGRPGRAGRERFRAVRRHRRAGRRTLRRSAAVGAPRRGAPRRGCVGRLAPADPAAFRRGSARPVGDRAAVRGFESGRGRQLPRRGHDAGAHRPARALSRPPPVLGPGGLLREPGNRSARARPQARLGLRGAGEHPLRKLARPCPRHADGRRRR